MYKNLPELEDVNNMSNIHDLRNALRWCIRYYKYLEEELVKAERRED
jgi:hypothetical protein